MVPVYINHSIFAQYILAISFSEVEGLVKS